MGHHINTAGEFQSDRNRDLAPDHVVVSFKASRARVALRMLAAGYRIPGEGSDPGFANDIETRLASLYRTECHDSLLVEGKVELSGGSRPTKPGNGTTRARAKRG